MGPRPRYGPGPIWDLGHMGPSAIGDPGPWDPGPTLENPKEIPGRPGKSLEIKYDKLPQGDVKESLANVSLVKKLIDWNYDISLKDGLKKYFF